MRLKTDENLPEELAALFREKGFDCLTALDQGLAAQPDSVVSAACREEGRILVTLDLGFANIRAYPPARPRSASGGKRRTVSRVVSGSPFIGTRRRCRRALAHTAWRATRPREDATRPAIGIRQPSRRHTHARKR